MEILKYDEILEIQKKIKDKCLEKYNKSSLIFNKNPIKHNLFTNENYEDYINFISFMECKKYKENDENDDKSYLQKIEENNENESKKEEKLNLELIN